MSYEPLHHKYRPKSFAELVGQEAIATTLTNAIRTAKIAPAYLFTGPRGTGKTSSARILAKSLNCLKSDKPTAEPCGVCDVCQGITKGYSLDVIEIDAASNTGVDNIRELIERSQFAPVQCRYKVYVVDECHMLSTAAFNALLKTLEEPPKHVVFVLATTDPQRVLPTIISRCQRFDFRRIALESMVKHLSAIASKENINITLEAVTLVAQVAQGGLRDAESLLDQLALLSGEVTPDKVWDLVGTVSERDLLMMLDAIAGDSPEAVLDCSRQILDRGREPLTILQNLAAFYRDLLIAKTAPKRNDLVACTQETWKAIVDFTKQLDITTILAGQQHLRTSELQLKNTTQPRLWLEVTLLGLLPSANRIGQTTSETPRFSPPPVSQNHRPSSPPTYSTPPISPSPPPPPRNEPAPTVTPNEAVNGKTQNGTTQNGISQNGTNQNGISQNGTNQNGTAQNGIAQNGTSQNEITQNGTAQYDLNQVWQQVLANLQPISRRELLRQMCQLLDFDGSVARIAVKQAWHKQLQADQPKITTAFYNTFKKDIKVKLEVATSNSTPPNKDVSANVSPPPAAQQPPAPTEEKAIAPPPEIPTTPVEILSKNPQKVLPSTASVLNTEANNHTPTLSPQPQAPADDWQNDEVMNAAKSLAKFFSGEIVSSGDDVADLADSTAPLELTDEVDVDDD
ncbi:MAG: DNA polymerase III subunit gamma/tau [Heteroscytonema crispum UTEX LB 1556]